MSAVFTKEIQGEQVYLDTAAVHTASAIPGESYNLIDPETNLTPPDIQASREGDDLVLYSKSLDVTAKVVGFWSECSPGETQCFAILDVPAADGAMGYTTITQSHSNLGGYLVAGEVGTLGEASILSQWSWTDGVLANKMLGYSYADYLIGIGVVAAAVGVGKYFYDKHHDDDDSTTATDTTAALYATTTDSDDDQTVNGTDNDDTLTGSSDNTVPNRISAGDGDDTINISHTNMDSTSSNTSTTGESTENAVIDGGNGNDTLVFTGAGMTLDLTNLPTGASVSNIETIDLTGTGDNSLVIGLDDLLVSDSNTLVVNGDAGDTVTVTGATKLAADTTINGVTYAQYDIDSNGTADLLVQTDVSVII